MTTSIPSQSELPPKVCFTVAGVITHQHKVLLVKHTKLGIWLAPGGHVEDGEMPHVAAERECWEECGLRVKAVSAEPDPQVDDSEYVPNPFLTNLHWVSKENYQSRAADPDYYVPLPQWKRGCEQHVCLIYKMQLIDDPQKATRHLEETTDMGWFTLDQLKKLPDVPQGILVEVGRVLS